MTVRDFHGNIYMLRSLSLLFERVNHTHTVVKKKKKTIHEDDPLPTGYICIEPLICGNYESCPLSLGFSVAVFITFMTMAYLMMNYNQS